MKFVTFLRSALLFLVLLALSIVHGVPGVANAATKKPAAKAKLSAFTASRFGSLKIRITDKSGKVSTKSIRVGAAKTLSIPAGAKVELVTKPTAGYKAGLIINGELVRFQSDKGKSVKVSARTKKPVFPELVFKLPKGTVSATATAVPLIEARFVPTGAPFAKEAGVVFSGLGSNIRVTNQNPVTLSGSAGSDVGVKSVTWANESTGGGGAAVGRKSWAAAIPFVEGDNKIRVNLIAKDGSTYTNDTVVTYFPAIDFNTPLNVSHDVLFVGVPRLVKFNIGLAAPVGAAVSLIETDSAGVGLPTVSAPMVDNGSGADEIDQDGLFSAQISVDTSSAGFKYYRAKVEKAGQVYYSETRSIWITTEFTSDQIKAAVDLANGVEARFAALVGAGSTELQAVTTILAEISLLPIVGSAGLSDSNALWWITSDGILGGFEPPRPNQKGGGRELATRNYSELVQTSGSGDSEVPQQVSYYTGEQIDNFLYRSDSAPRMSALTAGDELNRTSSHKSLLVSPYINNPNSSANFGNSDDFYGPWSYLQTNGSICSQIATKSVVNNGAVSVGFGDFKGLSEYGLIHYSTHGNNLYNGLLSTWNDVWGPNDFLKGYYSIVVLASGVYLPQNTDGTFDTATVSADLKAKRIAIFPTGSVYLLPGFFARYVDKLPRSLVFLSACRAAYNSSMVDVFLSKGALAVFGFTDYVESSYAQSVTNEMYTKLIGEDKTIKEGLDSAISKFGATDTSTPPAAPLLFGNTSAKRHSGALSNGGFEDGALSPWVRSGDGRLISNLGHFVPTSGSYMGIISTGLGFTTDSGSISQSFCLPNDATQIKFSWNFNSEEFTEFCDSIYQDTFQVQLCEVDPKTEVELSCTTLLYQTIDALCGSVVGVGFSFDQGGVYTTGWLNATLPVLPASLAGKSVKLKFSAGDVGDSSYDSAILLDDIAVSSAPPAP